MLPEQTEQAWKGKDRVCQLCCETSCHSILQWSLCLCHVCVFHNWCQHCCALSFQTSNTNRASTAEALACTDAVLKTNCSQFLLLVLLCFSQQAVRASCCTSVHWERHKTASSWPDGPAAADSNGCKHCPTHAVSCSNFSAPRPIVAGYQPQCKHRSFPA